MRFGAEETAGGGESQAKINNKKGRVKDPPYLSEPEERRPYRFANVRLSALTMALIEASSMLVSVPAPKSVVPRSVLIWM